MSQEIIKTSYKNHHKIISKHGSGPARARGEVPGTPEARFLAMPQELNLSTNRYKLIERARDGLWEAFI